MCRVMDDANKPLASRGQLTTACQSATLLSRKMLGDVNIGYVRTQVL